MALVQSHPDPVAALHAVGAILGMLYVFIKLLKGTLAKTELLTAQIFYGFVVLIWPVLFILVYLR